MHSTVHPETKIVDNITQQKHHYHPETDAFDTTRIQQETSADLEIINQFLQPNKTLDECFLATANILSAVYEFDNFYYNIRLASGARTGTGFRKNVEGVLEILSIHQFMAKLGKTYEQYITESIRDKAYFEKDSVLTGDALLAEAKKYPLLQTNISVNNIKSTLTIQHRHSYGHLVIGFMSKKENAYSERTLQNIRPLFYKLSIAIENKLVIQENSRKEKISSFQVQSIKEINNNSPWHDRLMAFFKLLKPFVPFDFAYICFTESTYKYGYGYLEVAKNEYQYVNREHFLNLVKTDAAAFDLQAKKFKKISAEHADSLETFEKVSLEDPVVKSMLAHTDMGSHLAFPCISSGKIIFTVHVFNRQPSFYNRQHNEFLQATLPGIAEAVYKNLHLEEIGRLKSMLELENKMLVSEKEYLQQEINATYNFEQIVGMSNAMQAVFERVRLVAPTDATVLLEGETGTGKELIARAIHNLSGRKNKPLIKVNCAALPSTLVESELFGHEKGSFTGALEKRLGKFELANGGTLFLDEIGDLSPEIQPKLLRVLQEMEVDRIGSNAPVKVNVRIIAATNKNLEDECAKKNFRADLYYRLNTFPIALPPLRERKEDIPLLADYFMTKFASKMGKKIKSISSNAMKEMIAYAWPGNIRELEHVIENAVIFCKDHMLELGRPLKINSATAISLSDALIKTYQDNEREHIIRVLKLCKGRIRGIGGAADILKLNPSTLESKMKKLDITRNRILQ